VAKLVRCAICLLPKGDERQGGFDPHSGAAVIHISIAVPDERRRNRVNDTN
jgi:hypothetical protein